MLPIKVIGSWVKGHYVGKNRELQHDMNDMADNLAITHLAAPPKLYGPLRCPLAPPGYRVRIMHNSSVITAKHYQTLSKAKHNNSLKAHIIKKTGLTELTFFKVDWKAHSSAFNKLTRYQRITTAKLIHQLSNVNKQNHLYYKTDPNCPICNRIEENFQHVLTCQDSRAIVYRTTRITQLETDLINIGTPPKVTKTILQGFNHWLTPPAGCSRAPTTGSLDGPDVLLTAAYYEQFYELNWFQCCLGRISCKWNKAVSSYWTKEGKKPESSTWTTKLILALWRYTKDIWQFRNNIVHGATVEDSTNIILTKLRDTFTTHYQAFQYNPDYVLSRHAYLF